MDNIKKIEFFNENLEDVIRSTEYGDIKFLEESLRDKRVYELLKEWPDEIKILIVDSFFAQCRNTKVN